jgi:hypothetical protein
MKYFWRTFILTSLILLAVAVLAMNSPSPAAAQGPAPTNASCLACHSNPALTKQLPSGEPLSRRFCSSLINASSSTDMPEGAAG